MTRLRLILLIIAGTLWSTLWAKDNYDSESRGRKSDYYFLEALRQRALGHEDLATAMMGRAYELDASKTDREAYELGSRTMIFAGQERDSLLFEQGVKLCEDYYGAHPDDVFVGSYLASFYVSNRNVERAKQIYDHLVKLKPNNPALTANYADILMHTQELDEAIKVYRNLEKSVGRNPALTQRITNVMVWQGDTVGAMAEIDDLIAAQPRNVEALLLGATAAAQFGLSHRLQDFEQRIDNAITDEDYDRDDKVELLRYSVASEMRRDTLSPRAGNLFESLVNQYPNDYELRMLYMSYLATNKQWLAAADQVEHAIAIRPDDPGDFELLARFYGSADDIDGVMRAARRGLEHHPQEIDLFTLLSAAQSRQKDYSGALETLKDALKVDSLSNEQQADLYRSMGDVAQQTGAPNDSILGYYNRALELNPDDDLAMNNLAYWLSTTDGGDLLRAKELIAKAVINEPGSATYYDTYAWVCYRLGDLENAKRYIDMAILFDKSDGEGIDEIFEHAADIYQSLGQLEKAKEFRERSKHESND